ncbi:DUF4442 domain-containing protein [Vibrio ezurae]|uniref:DUF4442 domain-containing protein n=1 Tax=Vibrio ezurae NBRC 102218 TaxID=1219080 RepID=U3CG42_9VIBR|nr:DUF4442 domain-containing protein [Vibrio ezurae]GAD80194.1 hypothetical protein VEZ01S_26_00320 [Vibrio ezurae NBRC 102218]
MFTQLQKANFYLACFGFFKVPLLWLSRPKIIAINDEMVEIKIPLRRRTKNHLNSMYIGALVVGADVAGGFLAAMKANQQGRKISLAFKGLNAEFLMRPESDVHFICRDGPLIDQMLAETIVTGQRVNKNMRVVALCPTLHGDKPMAQFTIMLSLKAK